LSLKTTESLFVAPAIQHKRIFMASSQEYS